MNAGKIAILLVHAFVGWALCFASIRIGMTVTSLDHALIAHAIGSPIYFAIVSLVYFRKFNFTAPLQTATIFIAFVIGMDFFVVAMLINRSALLIGKNPPALHFFATADFGRMVATS
jgi:hypothetical protein